jgi:hypothetical protein
LPPDFKVAEADRVNLAMAYLSYIGETLRHEPGETNYIYERLKLAIPSIKALTRHENDLPAHGKPDWKVVWGPAIYTFPLGEYQDNGMFVAQQISNPSNYIVAIRGTNYQAVLDWVFEDFNVLETHKWPQGKGSPKISEATHEGVKVLNDFLQPKSDIIDKKLPGEGMTLKQFLTVAAQSNKIHVSFTGHSLGGALAPTLALLFKQEQGKPGGWDSQRNATVTSTSFAGATAGNKAFADYSNHLMGTDMRRIHNYHDVVPHAWNKKTMEQIEYLYQPDGLELGFLLKSLLNEVIYLTKDKHYTQIEQSLPFTWKVKKNKVIGKTFEDQMSYQHTHSYPLYILGKQEGKKLMDVVNALK